MTGEVEYQEIWNEELLATRSMRLVLDNDEEVVLYCGPRIPYQSAAMGTARYEVPLAERIEVQLAPVGPMKPRRTGNLHMLIVAKLDSWSALWLFWRENWQFLRWYVNFQEPILRRGRTLEIRDCALDITVSPDRTWRWKDRDEFEALQARGFFRPETVENVEREAKRRIREIEAWASPFCDGWEHWRPQSAATPGRG